MDVFIVLTLLVGLVVFILVTKFKANNEWEESLNSNLKGFKDAAYKHIDTGSKSAIAINTDLQVVCLVSGANSKSYTFNQIRKWETNLETAAQVFGGGIQAVAYNMGQSSAAKRNSGLFLEVKDIDFPVWQIMFPIDTKAKLAKWMEILRQTLNEGKQ